MRRALFVWIGVAACGPPDAEPPAELSTEVVWQAGGDRLVLHTEHTRSFPEGFVRFSLHAGSHVVMTGSIQGEAPRVRATRLANGHLAWAVRTFVCEELSATDVACNDFEDLECVSPPCCRLVSGWTTCACALSNPDARLVDALRWVARDDGQDSRLRAGAALALAHTGARTEAIRIAETIPGARGSLLFLATRLDRADRDELRALRATGTRCVSEQIDHACGAACR